MTQQVPSVAAEPGETARQAPDPRDGRVYVMSREIDFAVRVAEATGRPLLLRGDPGSGKSSLAAYIARQRGWRYYEHVVTSRTQARDLLWTFDSVRRLADAEVHAHGSELHDYAYVEPGVLWWAFARDSALRRGAAEGVAPAGPGAGAGAGAGAAIEPNARVNEHRSAEHAVVLIDEIDKADPDLPNGLLVPLGSNEFVVTETRTRIEAAHASGKRIIVITTNEERALPQAFLRRCVVLWLEHPKEKQLAEIGLAHLREYEGAIAVADKALVDTLVTEMMTVRASAKQQGLRPPSTAEFLDALRACRSLDITVGSPDWARLRDLVLIKQQQPG
ncbi:MAG TPA: AAA family ATPase [Trebonia sp.]|nr:AAA family ATPase [Trebonia sp.]